MVISCVRMTTSHGNLGSRLQNHGSKDVKMRCINITMYQPTAMPTTHVANNTGIVFSVVCVWNVAMHCAIGTFTHAQLHHTTDEGVVQADVFCRSMPRPLLGNSQHTRELAE